MDQVGIPRHKMIPCWYFSTRQRAAEAVSCWAGAALKHTRVTRGRWSSSHLHLLTAWDWLRMRFKCYDTKSLKDFLGLLVEHNVCVVSWLHGYYSPWLWSSALWSIEKVHNSLCTHRLSHVRECSTPAKLPDELLCASTNFHFSRWDSGIWPGPDDGKAK